MLTSLERREVRLASTQLVQISGDELVPLRGAHGARGPDAASPHPGSDGDKSQPVVPRVHRTLAVTRSLSATGAWGEW